jgi:precorrin-8X/cobalt-precorrin-8 methylmutase
MTAHPIEEESYRVLAGRVDLSHLGPGARAVVERVIHASADLEFATSMLADEASVAAGVASVGSGAPAVVDVEMVGAGISRYPTTCLLGEASAGPGGFPTRSAMAVRLAAERHPAGGVWVIGCAPTALAELLGLVEAGRVRPALIIGLPVGFVGAAEAKAAARRLHDRTGLALITNHGDKGGSAVAAAAFNALLRLSEGAVHGHLPPVAPPPRRPGGATPDGSAFSPGGG